jgi:diguanylate cyclase (GGDEF)-like protein
MDMFEKSSMTKISVLENRSWRVYLGYENLQPVINKFKSLSGLLSAKNVINELVDKHSRIDALTGLLNKKGILERIEGEVLRYNRYGNVFSIVMCKVDVKGSFSPGMRQKAEEAGMKEAGEMLVKSLRSLDIVGRYEDNAFLILLPETDGPSAKKAINRLSNKLKDMVFLYDNMPMKLLLRFTSAEYASSIEGTLKQLT